MDDVIDGSLAPRITPRRFVRDVLVYSLSTVFVLAMGIVQTFVLPLWMAIEQYGYWRLFFLYVGYAGVASLGFTDGLLLRWSRLKIGVDATTEVQTAVVALIAQQLMLLLVVGIIGALVSPETAWLTLFILVGILATNLMTLGRYHLQASIEFRKAGSANIVNSVAFIILIALLYLWQGRLDAVRVMLVFLVATLGTVVWMIWKPLVRRHWWRLLSVRSLLHYGVVNTRLGLFVLLSNLGLLMAYTIDRMVVSWRFTIDDFAVYGLATSLVAIVYRIVGAISDVLFPYLSRLGADQQAPLYRYGKYVVLTLGGIALMAHFVMSPLILRYLPEYSASIAVARILLLSGGFGGVLRLLQVNYFKVHDKQFTFFLFGAVINLLFLIVAWVVSGTMQMQQIAVVGIVANLAWFTLNDFYICRLLAISSRSAVASLLFAAAFALPFIYLSGIESNLVGGIIYGVWCLVLLVGVAILNKAQLAVVQQVLRRT